MKSARFRFRFYPTKDQASQLAKTFGCVRVAFNRSLHTKATAYRERQENVSYADLDKELTALKKAEGMEWLQDVSTVPLQQAVRNLDKAYNAFFRKQNRFPRFKRKGNRQSATYTIRGFSMLGSPDPFRPLVKLAKQKEHLDIRWSRPLPSSPKSLTVVKEPDGRYYISFVVEIDPTPLPKTKAAVGIDLGLTDVYVTSDGYHSGNPRHFRKTQEKLKRAQRVLSRRVKGSGRWHRQRMKVAALHRRVRDQRADFLHKASINIVRKYDTICLEDLNIRGIVKNHSLAKSISDAGWGSFVQMLEYKADWYGKEVVKVDRWYPSSKTCFNCGHVVGKLPLNIRTWECPTCKTKHDRDVNAAMNIRTVGQAAAMRVEAG